MVLKQNNLQNDWNFADPQFSYFFGLSKGKFFLCKILFAKWELVSL